MMKRSNTNPEPPPNRITLIFAGTRMDNKKRWFLYYNESIEKYMSFHKKLLGYESIGTIIEVTRTDDGVQSPYTPIRRRLEYDDVHYTKVMDWSVDDRVAKEMYQAQSIAKKGCTDGTLDSLVDQICAASGSLNLREKIKLARYVFEKIIG